MSTFKLINQTQACVLADRVEIAHNFFTRARGLMGRKSLIEGSTLWIKDCTHVHTFFMKFSIDLLFVDQSLKVKRIFLNARPWHHFFLGTWKSDSVFEFQAGALKKCSVNEGDQLYVGN